MRRAAYELARSMDADIDYASLKGQIAEEHPDLAEFLRREKPSRPNANGDWEGVIVHGFKASPLPDRRASATAATDGPGYFPWAWLMMAARS